ncbi:hypothetical protein MADA3029_530025 [Vibrio nigripulchritudo MADA3029]|nr:hypothetical protein VIBNIMADA3020_570046 [Vibrio nigripulchritudo MADA3020]CCN54959.1 hypothetical protein VIBNIMADA3021_630025 [Vibrio nigripulchritudo MADA3021]CCN60104.1 hypothetical protein MADA3029_530025 [Vibrio nigripulchritudo MADA3029]
MFHFSDLRMTLTSNSPSSLKGKGAFFLPKENYLSTYLNLRFFLNLNALFSFRHQACFTT